MMPYPIDLRAVSSAPLRCCAIALILAVAIGLVSCTGNVSQDQVLLILESPAHERIRLLAEVADEPQERQRGLSGRAELAQEAGMIFLFDQEEVLSFWMKDTLIPLDILFFTSRGAFVSWSRMEPCVADPCPLYTSGDPARYAVEVPAGFVRDKGVGEGWTLRVR